MKRRRATNNTGLDTRAADTYPAEPLAYFLCPRLFMLRLPLHFVVSHLLVFGTVLLLLLCGAVSVHGGVLSLSIILIRILHLNIFILSILFLFNKGGRGHCYDAVNVNSNFQFYFLRLPFSCWLDISNMPLTCYCE